MMWLDIVAIVLSLATLGELQRLKKDTTLAHITDVAAALADLKATFEKELANVKAEVASASAAKATAAATSTWSAALDDVVTSISALKAEVVSADPGAPVAPAPAPAPVAPPIVPPVAPAAPAA